MLLQFGFLIHYLLLLIPLAFSSATYRIAIPGCQTHCGDMEIQFPFGIGSNCSMSPSFHIECNTSTNPPKAYLFNTNWEVTTIKGNMIRVKDSANMIFSCTGDTTTSNVFGIDLSSTPYTLSGGNSIVAIGCDDLVTTQGKAGQSFGDGCLPFCSNSSGIGSCGTTGSSARNGCCRIIVPKGTTRLSFSLSDIHEKWRHQKLFPCSYAFVGLGSTSGLLGQDSDWTGFSYGMPGLRNLSTFLKDNSYIKDTQLELEWRIGTGICSQARGNSTSVACQQHSYCRDFDAGVGGYHCHCSSGYVGNPYLSSGCQDINECVVGKNPCHSICTNTPGSFICSCPKGYYGDGTIDGTGCQPLPHSKLFSASIGVSSGIGFLVLLSVCIWLQKVYQRRREKKRKEKFFKRNGGLLLQQQTNEGTLGKSKLFSINELEKATDHFNKNRILGQGGQGTVYKGMLSDGKLAAIKKSKLVDENQLEQFINEVVLLSQINHRNVVKLLGCCLETEVPILVYELVPNGTLFDFIHDGNAEFPISWNMRLKIAADVAGALAYLHSATSLPIFHRDIKSSNILLDEKYIAKVSDFGTSKSVEADQTHLTTLVKGTFGYLDPEYFQSSQFTEKSDVYSFGVVLVELLTGQKPISGSEDARGLAARFLYSMETNSLERILDAQVSEEGGKDRVYSVARLAHRCLNLKGSNRPTMKDIATELESIRMPTMPSTIPVEYQEGWSHDETKPVILSDSEYTWPTTSRGVTSDTSPLMIETL